MKKQIVNKRPERKTRRTRELTLRDLKSDELASATGGGGQPKPVPHPAEFI